MFALLGWPSFHAVCTAAQSYHHTHALTYLRLAPLASPQAMFVDFGMAEQYGGVCYLRYDDTNPEAEKKEYIDHIQVGHAAPQGRRLCLLSTSKLVAGLSGSRQPVGTS